MAVYVPVRPRWNPRGEVVSYVSRGQLVARGWPKGYRDANTLEQQRQRRRMVQICNVLPYLKGVLAEGYAPSVKRNGRCVSGYHAAVGAALRGWFARTPGGERFDYARIRLTDGSRALPAGLTLARGRGVVRVAWGAGLPWGGRRLLLAMRQESLGQWVSVSVALGDGATEVAVRTLAAWEGREVEVWVAFVGENGRVRTLTHRTVLGAVGAVAGEGKAQPLPCPSLSRKGRAPSRGGAPGPRSGDRCRFRLPRCRCLVS